MSIKFNVNGFPYEVQPADFPADMTLNSFLREHLHLTATKYMCLEGGCGSCVCVIRRRHPATGEIRSLAVNSVCIEGGREIEQCYRQPFFFSV